MSSISTPDHARHWALYELPVEIVVNIMKASPSLSALWSFINTSARLATIFRGAAREITEAVMLCTVADQIQGLQHAVLQVRSSLFPSTLDAATQLATLCNVFESALTTSPEILRSFVFLAHKIHTLAHECIDHYRRTCMAMNPSELDEPISRYYSFSRRGMPLTAGKGPKGKPYQPKDAGPPSWTEEQVVILNLWRVQYYYDMRATHNVGRLEWSAAEQGEFLSMPAPEFFRLGNRRGHKWEQFMTVLAYIEGAQTAEPGGSHPFCLPCPTAPIRFDLECSPKSPRDERDGDSKQPGLEFRPWSWAFGMLMSMDFRNPALFGINVSHFRKFGFTLWEYRRMADLGLFSHRKAVPSGEYYFRWHSILSDEELDPANAQYPLRQRPLDALE